MANVFNWDAFLSILEKLEKHDFREDALAAFRVVVLDRSLPTQQASGDVPAASPIDSYAQRTTELIVWGIYFPGDGEWSG